MTKGKAGCAAPICVLGKHTELTRSSRAGGSSPNFLANNYPALEKQSHKAFHGTLQGQECDLSTPARGRGMPHLTASPKPVGNPLAVVWEWSLSVFLQKKLCQLWDLSS